MNLSLKQGVPDNANDHNSSQGSDEICPRMAQLLDIVQANFEMEPLSLKFKDSKMEEDYQQYYQRDMVNMAAIYVLFVLTFITIYTSFQIVKLATVQQDDNFICLVVLVLIFLVIAGVHFLLSKYHLSASLYFSSVQSFVVLLFCYEMCILGNMEIASVDGFIISPTLVLFLGSVSYCQKQMLFSYIITWMFNILRTYFWFEDTYRYLRFATYWTLVFVILYVASRWSSARDRNKFKQDKSHKLLLQMFNNLMKVFHDGIIIAQKEKITFSNKQADKIFQSGQQTSFLEPQSHDIESQLNRSQECSQVLIQSMKDSLPNDSIDQLETIEDNGFDYNNMWDYLQLCQQFTNSSHHSQQASENPLNGKYFKFSSIRSDDGGKKLQVFTQLVSLGNIKMLMVTIRDMSWWLELEKQKHITQTQTLAFASAAHEFRNPLNGIIQSLDLLKYQVDLSNGEGSFTAARNCTQLMLYQVNDILDYAQYESKQIILNLEMVDLQELFNQCINVMQQSANAKSIDLFTENKCEESCFLLTDQNRLRQILINLLSNAIKYTFKGYVKIVCALERHHIAIKVEDSGVGISEQDQAQMFSPFLKIKSNRQMNANGCGLGLLISKRLSSALGADLSFRSELGSGTTFSLQFPRQQAQSDKEVINLVKTESFSLKKQYRNSQIERDSDLSFNNSPGVSSQRRKERGLFNSSPIYGQEAADLSILEDSSHQLDLLMKRTPIIHDMKIMMPKTSVDKSRDLIKRAEQKRNSAVVNNELVISVGPFEAENHYSFRQEEKKNNTERSLIASQKLKCQCKQILIVDDEPFNLMALEGMLEVRGLTCDKAYNGQDALSLLQENSKKSCREHQPYRLLIVDNSMPIMSGIELAQEIAKFEQQYCSFKNLKLTLLSGQSLQQMEHLLKRNDAKGVFDFVLEKPLSEQNLQSLLSSCKFHLKLRGNSSVKYYD